jgi:hypothetical protein
MAKCLVGQRCEIELHAKACAVPSVTAIVMWTVAVSVGNQKRNGSIT